MSVRAFDTGVQMNKYRKKPVTIQAVVWDESRKTMNALRAEGMSVSSYNGHVDYPDRCQNLCIDTLESQGFCVSPGDYIIKGVKGEFYACKADIFALTYEAVTDRNFQTMVSGQPVPVSNLTREQAIDALCDAYELIEALDSDSRSIQERIEQWRGK